MALRNTETSWGSVSRALHWGFALAILVEVVAGLVMSRTFGSKDPAVAPWHYWTSNVHHTLGLLLLVAAAARATWRLVGPVPAPVRRLGALQEGTGRTIHWLLYALLLVVPLSGWAALSSLADSPSYGRTVLWFFGSNGFDTVVPRIVPPVPWDSHALFRYSTFARSHRWLLIAGAALLALHVAAALRHHFLLKDDTLRRMLFGRAP